MKFSRYPFLALFTFLMFILHSCANMVPPSGGSADTTAPVLLTINPADSILNARPTKIELRFNKFMVVQELDKNMALSPILSVTPTVTTNGRKVTISIADSALEENTTYRIGLGNALTDNRESTPYKNFVYVFSTGAYFDSLELHGRVYDARTGQSDTAILIALYADNENDTAVMRKKPRYIARADAAGSFSFKSLPKRRFRMYAVQDGNNNYLYDYGEEKIGFLNYSVMPSLEKDSNYVFYTFREVKDTALALHNLDSTAIDSLAKADSVRIAGGAQKRRKFGLSKISKSNIGYQVQADTTDINKRSFDIKKPLTIRLTTEIVTLDSAKVYLSYDNNGIEVEAVQKLSVDSENIKISTQWLYDKVYTLRLVKGWAKDSAGTELTPGKYKFRTKGDQDYGGLVFHLDKSYVADSLLLNVYKGTDSLVYTNKITDSIVSLKLLEPGDYNARIIIDNNKNGKWDPGNLLKHLQPEQIINYPTAIILKAGWDNEIDFNRKNAVVPGTKEPKPPKDVTEPARANDETER